MNAEGLAVLKIVIDALDSGGIPYMLSGSYASSFYGVPRATFGADLVVQLAPSDAGRLYACLKGAFYADEEEIARAAGERASFNLIHLDTAFKIDIFTLKPDAYSKQAFARRVKQPLSQGGGAGIWLQAPEDVIISKLQWYKLGGETSAKQPSDITGVLKTQGGALDTAYLSLWLERLALTDLFQKIQSAA
ncbi:MAG: hypothetical protein A2X29_03020 [Elusimicrobia bacterium GWA2_64_40]|nr:MAG: hypothetical protein A2X29_03020 [Elusimicrobia bacterium GWA2_64_40]